LPSYLCLYLPNDRTYVSISQTLLWALAF
jgi:hypothetical protein